MAQVRKSDEGLEVVLTNDEFNTIKNCINETLEALHGDDFRIRVGATRDEAVALLELLLSERKRLQGTSD